MKAGDRKRRVKFSPKALENLDELKATVSELKQIGREQVRLGRDASLGYPVPLDYELFGKRLFRYDVGRFGLIYTIGKYVEIVSVV